VGDRLASSSTTSGTTTLAWIVPDLHGNVVAQCSADGTSVLDVLRYDAYGKTLGSANTPSAVPLLWRFQGRILESRTGSEAYDFTARAYLPDLGTFASLDSVTGGAQNPLTLNRYLWKCAAACC
jgi:RHS repeat-associated protein